MSTSIGRAAEDAAAAYLQKRGFKIIERNWRTRWCEIDIVAKKGGVTFLVESKYRSSSNWGDGFDYITPRKLQQMQFAAQFWQSQNTDGNCQLAAIQLSGNPPKVTGWLDSLY